MPRKVQSLAAPPARGVERPRLDRGLPGGFARAKRPGTVRRILSAAEAIFAERGLAGARIEEIARTARVNKALLYYYFGSKKKLYQAVFEDLFSQASQSIQAATPTAATARQAILGFLEGYFQFRVANPNYARLMQRLMLEDPDQFRRLARERFRPGFEQLANTIRQGIANGEFRSLHPAHTVINLLAMIVFYFSGAPVHSVLLGCDALRPARVAAHKRAIFELLEHGLFRGPAKKHPAKRHARRRNPGERSVPKRAK